MSCHTPKLTEDLCAGLLIERNMVPGRLAMMDLFKGSGKGSLDVKVACS